MDRVGEVTGLPGTADGGRGRGAAQAVRAAAPGFSPVASQERPRHGGRERPEPHRQTGPARPVPGTGPGLAGNRPTRPGAPGQVRTYTLAVRVIAQLYPPLDNQRRWAFQNALELSREHPLIRAAARWDKLDEAAVTIQCQARDAAAAAEAARAMIRRTARLTGQIGIRDIKITRVTPAG
jgi:hypothetical protein